MSTSEKITTNSRSCTSNLLHVGTFYGLKTIPKTIERPKDNEPRLYAWLEVVDPESGEVTTEKILL